LEEAHCTSLAARRKFTEQQLNEWILKFYANTLAYYVKNIGKETLHGTKITDKLIKVTRRRYLILLMRKYNVTNGQLPRINK
jgi:hypothetical protein